MNYLETAVNALGEVAFFVDRRFLLAPREILVGADDTVVLAGVRYTIDPEAAASARLVPVVLLVSSTTAGTEEFDLVVERDPSPAAGR
jgi:predicted secreted protein